MHLCLYHQLNCFDSIPKDKADNRDWNIFDPIAHHISWYFPELPPPSLDSELLASAERQPRRWSTFESVFSSLPIIEQSENHSSSNYFHLKICQIKGLRENPKFCTVKLSTQNPPINLVIVKIEIMVVTITIIVFENGE